MKKNLLRLCMALCMMLAVLPIGFASDSEADQALPSPEGGTITITQSGVYTLSDKIYADIVISAGTVATIDLNGCVLMNAAGHTITNHGTLTIRDTQHCGKVDNISDGKAAVYNDVGATVTLESGIFDRSQESGISAENSGGNSSCTLRNYGNMTILKDVTVMQNGTANSGTTGMHSSLIENGWENAKNPSSTGEPTATEQGAVLTIYGGVFYGGLRSVSNMELGTLVIHSGNFADASMAIVNYHIADITGGNFSVCAEDKDSFAIYNFGFDSTYAAGKLTISDGIFEALSKNPEVMSYGLYDCSTIPAAVSISGGSITGSTAAVAKSSSPEEQKAIISITGGTFNTDPCDFVAEGYEAYQSGKTWTVSTAHVHVWDEETITRKPTCKETGEKKRTCTACGATTIVEVSRLTTHAWDLGKVTTEPTATKDGIKTYTCIICGSTKTEGIFAVAAESIVLDQYELTLAAGAKSTLKATVKGDGYTGKVMWTSSNEEIATVDENGKVTTVGTGIATITAAIGEKTAKAKITVLCSTRKCLYYTDVVEDEWYHVYTDYAKENGLMQGTDLKAKAFEPEAQLTRAELAQILYNLEGKPKVDVSKAMKFTDVGSEWYTDAVNWASANGVVNGYYDEAARISSFKPDQAVTRQEMVTMIYRYAKEFKKLQVSTGNGWRSYKDANQVEAYAENAIAWAVENELVNGTSKEEKILEPNGTAERAQIAKIMSVFVESYGLK